MKIMKQFGLAAALCVAVALCSAGTAFADELTPPPNSPSPGASGWATTNFFGPVTDDDGVSWFADTTFHVKGLQPNAVYWVSAYDGTASSGGSSFMTDRKGAGRARFS